MARGTFSGQGTPSVACLCDQGPRNTVAFTHKVSGPEFFPGDHCLQNKANWADPWEGGDQDTR